MSTSLKVKESAWCKKGSEEVEPVVSFAEIMSEELAEQLEEEDANVLDPSIAQYGLSPSELLQCKNDLELARKLQEEFDREYEMSLKLAKGEATGTKIEFGFVRYHPSYNSDYDLEEELSEDDEDLREIAIDFVYSRTKDEFPPSGYMRNASGHLITKHDKEIAERRNSEKVMHLPINIPTGDVVGERLSNRVYNKLRNYGKVDQRRNAREKDKDEKATNELSMDKVTRLIIYRFITSGLFDVIENVIATGKESIVLHATAHDGMRLLEERHCALKVYKMTLSEFKNRSEYVQDDYRFRNPRRVLRIWAEKEYTNLNRMVRGGVKCPKPIRLRKHIMIMTFIGSNGIAARKLKDIEWSDQEIIYNTFLQVKAEMIKMFTNCNLVHGDLSEFNVLYHESDVYIIDVSQAMDISHPRALFFLLRDVDNVLEFFAKLGAKNLPSATELFNEITGLNMDPEENLAVQVEHFEKDNRNVQLRCDKANPADMELRLYDAEVAETHNDPAEPYN
ncbi:atypical/RIO/RIO3 protein kinase [Loa loa]|uniref:Serine/threonine-protein kinase RIO3 n=1 Tax=Loa loa TaxID=7209 RepID=A0A1I7VKL8_LOALO|nr:atypical/RIO/RIO3 protein kinase [Loa loa]EFO27525.1 atypical/RIO/RIO3 protein kinase [Loa loa]